MKEKKLLTPNYQDDSKHGSLVETYKKEQLKKSTTGGTDTKQVAL